jgi:hypothetical protein
MLYKFLLSSVPFPFHMHVCSLLIITCRHRFSPLICYSRFKVPISYVKYCGSLRYGMSLVLDKFKAKVPILNCIKVSSYRIAILSTVYDSLAITE